MPAEASALARAASGAVHARPNSATASVSISDSASVSVSEDTPATPRAIVIVDVLKRQLAHAAAHVRSTGKHHEFVVHDHDDITHELQAVIEPFEGTSLKVSFRALPEDWDHVRELNLLRVALQQTNDVVLVTNAEPLGDDGLRIVFVNAAFTRMTGYSPGEVIGKSPKILQGAKTNGATTSYLRSQLSQWRHARAELLNYRKDGSEFWVEIDLAPVADEAGWYTHWIAIQRETTERRRREEQNLVASKMESLSVLASGIAHDFNNALASILACSSLAERLLSRVPSAAPEDARRAIANIGVAVEHARSLTKQLMAFSKGGSSKHTLVQLGRIVREMTTLVMHGSNVLAEVNVDDDVWVEGDAGQLGQAVVNLVLNARAAMPHGGTLQVHVTTTEVTADQELPLAPGRYAKLVVRDSGEGIPAPILARIFEPYFTTKTDGAGLGLAVVYSVVRKHHGHVSVVSEAGSFTEFTVLLAATTEHGDAAKAGRAEVATGSGNVLVMDDEVGIRWSLSLLLRDLGYASEMTADAGSAVAAFKRARSIGAPFTTVLLDMTLPGSKGGLEVAEELRALDKKVPIFLMSGYSDGIAKVVLATGTVQGFLEKPFNLDALSHALASAQPPTKQPP